MLVVAAEDNAVGIGALGFAAEGVVLDLGAAAVGVGDGFYLAEAFIVGDTDLLAQGIANAGGIAVVEEGEHLGVAGFDIHTANGFTLQIAHSVVAVIHLQLIAFVVGVLYHTRQLVGVGPGHGHGRLRPLRLAAGVAVEVLHLFGFGKADQPGAGAVEEVGGGLARAQHVATVYLRQFDLAPVGGVAVVHSGGGGDTLGDCLAADQLADRGRFGGEAVAAFDVTQQLVVFQLRFQGLLQVGQRDAVAEIQGIVVEALAGEHFAAIAVDMALDQARGGAGVGEVLAELAVAGDITFAVADFLGMEAQKAPVVDAHQPRTLVAILGGVPVAGKAVAAFDLAYHQAVEALVRARNGVRGDRRQRIGAGHVYALFQTKGALLDKSRAVIR